MCQTQREKSSSGQCISLSGSLPKFMLSLLHLPLLMSVILSVLDSYPRLILKGHLLFYYFIQVTFLCQWYLVMSVWEDIGSPRTPTTGCVPYRNTTVHLHFHQFPGLILVSHLVHYFSMVRSSKPSPWYCIQPINTTWAKHTMLWFNLVSFLYLILLAYSSNCTLFLFCRMGQSDKWPGQ